MTGKAKNVLSLNHEEAMDFFLKSEQYHGFELPEYFVFDKLLQQVKDTVGETPYEECLQDGASPEQLPDVNLDILLNKDGRYAVRPIVLANPFLYYFMVREICSEPSWAAVKQMFEKFSVPHITSCALPVVSEEKEPFHKSATILNWWNSMEQRSIELSLEYRYMFVTDITNCYGSVNPQAFDWAFSFKGTKYEQAGESPVARNVQKILRAFQQGRNVGIPQGSALFDFAGEIVLGYSDLLLHEALQREGIEAQYEIVRYRDDYRIFCNDKDELERISYTLQHVLESLNFRMNSKKTMISESIVTDAVKPDKLDYIYNTPVFNKKGCDFDSFEKHLLYILMFARQHPNSGTVKTMLSDIDKRMEQWFKPRNKAKKKSSDSILDDPELLRCSDDTETLEDIIKAVKNNPYDIDLEGEDTSNWIRIDFTTSNEQKKDDGSEKAEKIADNASGKEEPKKTVDVDNVEEKANHLRNHGSGRELPGGSVRAMAAICTQIALENVGVCHYALRVLSRMVNSLKDEAEKSAIVSLVYSKLCHQPNSDYNQLWLQNITYRQDKVNGTSPYKMRLCRVVAGDEDVVLWNNTWVKPEYASGVQTNSIVDAETLKKVTPVITFRETRTYYEL